MKLLGLPENLMSVSHSPLRAAAPALSALKAIRAAVSIRGTRCLTSVLQQGSKELSTSSHRCRTVTFRGFAEQKNLQRSIFGHSGKQLQSGLLTAR